MTLSKGLLDSLEKLVAVSNEDCTCSENMISCRKCFAIQELHATHERVDEILEMIEIDFKK